MRAHGCGGASAFPILYFLAPVASLVWKILLRAGKKEGGLGEGIFARPLPNRSPATLLVQSRGQQKSFLFLLKEKEIARQIKKCEENFFAGQRAERAAAGRSVQNSAFGFSSKNVRTSSKNDRQLSHFEKTRLVASRLRRSALNFAGIFQAFFKSKESVRSAMRKFAERSSGKTKFCKPIFLFPPSAEKQSDIFFDCPKVNFKTIWTT